MAHRVVITGVQQGELRWVYHRAALVDDWTITTDTAGTVLTGRLREPDALAVSQRPLVFEVSRPTGPSWRWPVETLQIAGDRLTANLSLQE